MDGIGLNDGLIGDAAGNTQVRSVNIIKNFALEILSPGLISISPKAINKGKILTSLMKLLIPARRTLCQGLFKVS